MNFFKHETAIIDEGAKIGHGTKIWHWVHVSNDASIGKDCILGQNVYIGNKAVIGNNVKIQNNVSIYQNVIIEDEVFCGPSTVFTNINIPRAFIERKDKFAITIIKRGATLGANCTIICGVTVGQYAFIGAGAVVTKNVKPHALMLGVPAIQKGWVSHAGEVLGGELVCPYENRRYAVTETNELIEIKE